MIITYDYSKAFDSLRSDLIVNRLIQCNFPRLFVLWVYDYLTNRSKFVSVGCERSSVRDVTSGVPQGSVIGPYLFSVATSSFTTVSQYSHLVKYADDTTLCFPIFKSRSNEHIFNEHNNVIDWSSRMSLTINQRKCKCLIVQKAINCDRPSISIPGVEMVASLKILGVTFCSTGAWSKHVDNVILTTSRRFYALRILRPILPNAALKTVYFALIRSVLEYCAPLFIGISTTDKNRINRVQRRFHRLLCGKDCKSNCLPSLEFRREYLTIKFLHDVMSSDHILNGYLPRLSNTGRFILPPQKTVRRSRTFMLRACHLYHRSCRR